MGGGGGGGGGGVEGCRPIWAFRPGGVGGDGTRTEGQFSTGVLLSLSKYPPSSS